jgi:hypothetical protein
MMLDLLQYTNQAVSRLKLKAVLKILLVNVEKKGIKKVRLENRTLEWMG